MLAPVALFTYNRPAHTRATLDALARNTLAEQTHLFVFSDGPKNDADAINVESVRESLRTLQGFASVTLVEREKNLGLAKSVITGVTDLLTRYESIVVLEDDLITSPNFLAYMNGALEHYREDPFAFSVTGHTFPESFLPIPDDYPYDTYAAYRCSSWSWGTWRDRWQRIDWDMRYFTSFCRDTAAQEQFNRGGQDMVSSLRMQHEGKIDSWAIRFCHAHTANDMRCIYPTRTLVKNLGLDNTGTHSTPNPRFFHLSLDESWLPVRYCPAGETVAEITDAFRAIFDPPPVPLARVALRKTRWLARNFLQIASKAIFKARQRISGFKQDADILVVNTYQKNGGAARAAYRMFNGIRKPYPGARYLNLFRDDQDSGVIGLIKSSIRGSIAQRLVRRDQAPLRQYRGKQETMFTPALSANPLRIAIARFRPKLVHLHWVGDSMLRVEEIGKLRCPVVWTLHDAWAFTGGCHYVGTCDGYRKQCGSCPQLGSTDSNDLSRSLMRRKSRAYKDANLTIVTPSRWLAEVAATSSLLAGRRIEVIPNGLDTDTFKPIDRIAAREYWGITDEHPVILFGTHIINDHRKGGDLLCKALSLFGKPCTLLTFGDGELKLENAPLARQRRLGSLSDDASLALAYSTADAFICPSREDNLPNTVAESLACGTPCVAFAINGLPEMIDHMENGWLAKPFDAADLAKGIDWVVTNVNREQLRQSARDKALAEYGMKKMASRYASLYEDLLKA